MIVVFLFLLYFLLPLVLTNKKTCPVRCPSVLSLRGRRLDLSLALVFGRGDAGERVGFLLLHF